MRPHPLRGPARWLVLPALSIGGGAALGAFAPGTGPLPRPEGWTALVGAIFAGAAGVGCAASGRLWLNLLVAAVLAQAGWAAALGAPERLLKPSADHVLTLALSCPFVALYFYRARAWAYAASVALLPIVWLASPLSLTAFLLYLGLLSPALHFGVRELSARLSSSAGDVG